MPEWLEIVFRLIVGLNFLIFGINGFLKWIPLPKVDSRLTAFVDALDATGFLLTTVKILEIAAGLLLLLNWQVRLAIVVLGPLVTVIGLAQVRLNTQGSLPVLVTTVVPYLVLLTLHSEIWQFLTAH